MSPVRPMVVSGDTDDGALSVALNGGQLRAEDGTSQGDPARSQVERWKPVEPS